MLLFFKIIMKRKTKKLKELKRPLIITIVGTDGSGKTKLLGDLLKRLEGKGLNVGTISMPSLKRLEKKGKPISERFGEKLRHLAEKGAETGRKESVLMSWMGAGVPYSLVKMAAQKGKDVLIVERGPWLDAKIYGSVYGAKKAVPLVRFLTADKPADITIFAKCDPEVALYRITERKNVHQLHETEEMLGRINEAYEKELKLMKKKFGNKVAVLKVNANQPRKERLNQTMNMLRKEQKFSIRFIKDKKIGRYRRRK